MKKVQVWRQRRGGKLSSKLLVVLAATLLVVVPVLVVELPREVARWYQAAADEAELNEDWSTAIARLDTAITWDDSNPQFHAHRARLKLEIGRWESALEDCDQVRELSPDTVDIAYTRSQLLMHLGRHESAIAELKALLYNSSGGRSIGRADQLNALAYACAVGKRELDEGLEMVEESLSLAGTHTGILDPLGYLYFHRGYTAMVQKETDIAVESLNEAVRIASSKYEKNANRLKVFEKLPRDKEEYARRERLLKSHLAGILTVRESLWQELEEPEKAERDRKQLDSLAPSGNVTIAQPMDLMRAISRLQQTANILDTRGFLHYQRGDFRTARRDMHNATAMIDAVCATFSWQAQAMKYRMVDIRRLTGSRRNTRRGKAVMYYHQMLVHEALGMEKAAVKDRGEVTALGYEPNEQLF